MQLSSDSTRRVMVVGATEVSSPVINRLTREGFLVCLVSEPETLLSVASELRPEAALFTTGRPLDHQSLSRMKAERALSRIPIMGDLSSGDNRLRELELDDWVHTQEELVTKIQAALTARLLMERDAQARLRRETLLDIIQAASSSLDLMEILSIAVAKIARILAPDRCSVILVEGGSPRVARVVASHRDAHFEPRSIDLVRYPELRRSLETRQGVYIEDVAVDPLMTEVSAYLLSQGVQSVLVEPLICQDDIVGALFLRLSRGVADFGHDDIEFVRTVAGALANSIRNAQLHAALRRKRDDLEFAYVDRYRELSEANRRLRDANRVKDELIAVCSHDLRSPLNVLLGHGRMLVESTLQPPQAASAQAIVRQAQKVLELVESLLERGSLERQTLTMEARRVDLSELSQEVTRDLEIIAKPRLVQLQAEAPESLTVMGDRVKLHQVLQNIITNAIHHSPKGGIVFVRVGRHHGPDREEARVVIQDGGPGIPSDQLHLVFDRYRHGAGGLGLGLAICKEIVELHGGEIWAGRPSVGGTEMVFTLPLLAEQRATAVEPISMAPVEEQVLVVEDEPDIAAKVSSILRTRYRVEIARDGAEGLAKARSLHPDLILMNVFLPKLDGLDAALALKSSPETSRIPVVFLSAQQAIADKVQALNLGAADYLAKPFRAADLLACVDRVIRLRKAEEELDRSRSLIRRAGNDPETGLLHWEGFAMRFDQEASRSRRYDRDLCLALLRPASPVKCDARALASVIRRRLRASDVVAHLGEGTFALIMSEATPEGVTMVFTRLVAEIMEELKLVFESRVADTEKGRVTLETAWDRLLGSRGLIA